MGVKEVGSCESGCSDEEFDKQFATMREFCSDTADSWDGECVSDCHGSPGSKPNETGFNGGMSGKKVCSFLLNLKSGDSCLADCTTEDFTEINSIRDECQQVKDSPEDPNDDDANAVPVEHMSAVSSSVLVGGFTLESFLERLHTRRKLETTKPGTLNASGCAASTEPRWCQTNLPPSADGTLHENCHTWEKDCPCTCTPLESEAPASSEPATAPPVDAATAIAQKHAQEAAAIAAKTRQGGGPSGHRGEEAFIAAMAHTMLVRRSEVDILNIVNRDIQITDRSGVVKDSHPGVQIEFGVRFAQGAEQEQKLVAEKLRSMNLGCKYLFSGRLYCNRQGGNERQSGMSREHGTRALRWLQDRGIGAENSEDSEHTAVTSVGASATAPGASTEGTDKGVDLMDEFRWAFSTELQNRGMVIPEGFSILAMEKPVVVSFTNEHQQAQALSLSQPHGQPPFFPSPPSHEGLSGGEVAGVLFLVVGLLAAGAAVVMVVQRKRAEKKRSKFAAQERFDAARSVTSSFNPSDLDDRPNFSNSHSRGSDGDGDDEVEVVDLDNVDSI
jgi:hypothetical protein